MNAIDPRYPYASRRMVVHANHGMVATSQHLAAQAGLTVLQKGGNAVDAAIATAAALTVLEPTANGIGSDAFAIILHDGKLYGLNASGSAPNMISLQAVKDRGYQEMPRFGWLPVTVPGTPMAWANLSKRFGKLPFAACLEPAIAYAETGYPLSPVLARGWNRAHTIFQKALQGEEFRHWFDTFAPHGHAPAQGEIWRSPDHAKTLLRIADSMAQDFYQGDLAEQIVNFSIQHGGFLRKSDLESFRTEWVDPIKVTYRGYDVWELPPNGQGLIALMALNILNHFSFAQKETIDTYHVQMEAIKLAFADGKMHITDPEFMKVSIAELLAEEFAKNRSREIHDRALVPVPGRLPSGGTVYLATADQDGNMVSYIQSNYMGFGSGLVVPGTGIALQNRGHSFSLDERAVNALEPNKRTYHTIIPGFLGKVGQPIGPFGVMGGYMQPQGHMQVVSNLIDFHMNPQTALDAPRWQWIQGKKIAVEPEVPAAIVEGLIAKGHEIEVHEDRGEFGRGQIILRDTSTGVLTGGTESRTDSGIACW